MFQLFTANLYNLSEGFSGNDLISCILSHCKRSVLAFVITGPRSSYNHLKTLKSKLLTHVVDES